MFKIQWRYREFREPKNSSIIRIFILVLPIVLAFSATSVFANPNILLSNAMRQSLRLDQNLPTKERLAIYEQIFYLLEQITTEHPSSEQAIKIISQQEIGKFNPSHLKYNYVKELTEYYDIVCEKVPSFSCLGFVSLKSGRQQCKAADTVETIVKAHRNINNAARIFISQKQKSAYISLALNEYKACLRNSNFKQTEYARDFFSSEIFNLFLQMKNESRAIATIENMTNPAFKFAGVLKLYESQGKEFSKSFFDRMTGYISKKIAKNEGAHNAPLSAILLADAATRRAKFRVGYKITYGAVQNYRSWGIYATNCYPFFSKTLFTILTDYQYNIVNMPEGRNGVGRAQLPSLMNSIAERASGPLGACKQDPNITIEKSGKGQKYSADVSPSAQDGAYYDYYLMTAIHGQLLLFKPEKAAEFRRRAIDEYWPQQQQIRFALNAVIESLDTLKSFMHLVTVPKNEDMMNAMTAEEKCRIQVIQPHTWEAKLKKWGIDRIELRPSEMMKLMRGKCVERFEDCNTVGPVCSGGAVSSEKQVAPDLETAFIRTVFTHPLARPIVFEKMVDFGGVCEASKILFQELKNTKYFDDAIEYMVTSPSINPNQKYECGDEDLELLLK